MGAEWLLAAAPLLFPPRAICSLRDFTFGSVGWRGAARETVPPAEGRLARAGSLPSLPGTMLLQALGMLCRRSAPSAPLLWWPGHPPQHWLTQSDGDRT